MGSHPINLVFRFLLELTALITVGIWGWRQSDNWLRFVLALGLPIILAAIWGTFAVPNDPSRSGAAPVVTNGYIRLFIEFAFFSLGTCALYNIGYIKYSIVFAVAVILHYAVSYDRIMWLIKQ
jgi:hypothetical protein